MKITRIDAFEMNLEECAVENCQVLGCALGESSSEAVDVLLKENSWILEAAFREMNL